MTKLVGIIRVAKLGYKIGIKDKLGSAKSDVYETSIASTTAGVIHGLNATVFAYGSTRSGKTYTMVGARDDPGLMVLSLNTIFDLIKQNKSSDDFEVNCSYLEVYNEVGCYL